MEQISNVSTCCSRISALSFPVGNLPFFILISIDSSIDVVRNYPGVGISTHAQPVCSVACLADHPLQGICECYIPVGDGERSYLLDRSIDADVLPGRDYGEDTERGGPSNKRKDFVATVKNNSHWNSGFGKKCGAGWGMGVHYAVTGCQFYSHRARTQVSLPAIPHLCFPITCAQLQMSRGSMLQHVNPNWKALELHF